MANLMQIGKLCLATNQLVLAYTPQSKYANEINANNWYQIISQPDVRLGFTDPRMDSVGYRTLMALVLAESYYGVDNIMDDTVGKYFSTPITADEENVYRPYTYLNY